MFVIGLLVLRVLVLLNAIPMLVLLKKFVILLIFGLWYVHVVQKYYGLG